VLITFTACLQKEYDYPGKPLVWFDFNENLDNHGMMKLSLTGSKVVSYGTVEKDTVLDLSSQAFYRKPLQFEFPTDFSFNDYDGFTVAFWLKKEAGDVNSYTVLSHQKMNTNKHVGWEIKTTPEGSWQWKLADSIHTIEYRPTVQLQSIEADEWTHLAFSLDRIHKEIRFYYNGKNVAIYGLNNMQVDLDHAYLSLGTSIVKPVDNEELFNGLIDDLGIWSRVLTHEQVQTLCSMKRNPENNSKSHSNDFLKLMTWNIHHGGRTVGKYVGLKRIVDIVKEVNPDILFLQETNGAGEFIADGLDYCFYRRGENLSVLSRYPIVKSYDFYRSEHLGCVDVRLSDDMDVMACPIYLSDQPNFNPYIRRGDAVVDSILAGETQSRGLETKFILSELNQVLLKKNHQAIILAGDLNCGSHLDWTERNRENNYGLAIEYPSTQQIFEAGFVDSYRHIFPDERDHPGYTWSPIIENTVKNRTNFIFYTNDYLEAVDSYLVEDHQLGFPSDHAALVTVLKIKK